jgi:hypothetical protein
MFFSEDRRQWTRVDLIEAAVLADPGEQDFTWVSTVEDTMFLIRGDFTTSDNPELWGLRLAEEIDAG